MQVADLVARLTAANAEAEPHKGIVRVLKELKGDLDGVAEALAYIAGTGGNARQIFYRAPDLSLLKVRFPNGRRTPPHNHGCWAAILVLSGTERNHVYRRAEGGTLTLERKVDLGPGDIIYLPADAVHVAECSGDGDVFGLHVYGGDVLGLERSMWDPDTVREEPLEWTKYETFAQRASAAQTAPLA
tara:strand:+ start:206 stop:766 length:561 start_codon:yes stop_codon:yes gene_type:complete